MKITKSQLKNLIREQVQGVLEGSEWFDVYGDDYPVPQSQNADNTEASMTPNKDVEVENMLMQAIEAALAAGYSTEEIKQLANIATPTEKVVEGDRAPKDKKKNRPQSKRSLKKSLANRVQNLGQGAS